MEWLLIPVAALIAWIMYRSAKHSGNVKEVLASGVKEADRIAVAGSTVIFDSENRQIAIMSANLRAVVPYDKLRQWSFEPRYNLARNSHIGYTFRITTSDPAQPLYNVPINGTSESVPAFWMAKFNAHING